MAFPVAFPIIGSGTRTSLNVAPATTVGSFDSAYATFGIRPGGGIAEYFQTANHATTSTIWWQFDCYTGTPASTAVLASFHNAAGTPLFRLIFASATTIQAQYWNGSTWVAIGSTYAVSVNTRYIFDLKIVEGASGSFELYSNSSLVLSGSASMTSVVSLVFARFYCTTTSPTAATWPIFSQIKVSDASTIGQRTYTRLATSNGTHVDFTGVFSDIAETTLDDTTYVTGDTNGEKETFASSAITFASGNVIAVGISSRVKKTLGGVANIRHILTRTGVDYTAAAVVAGLGEGFIPASDVWLTDPGTSVAWTKTAAGSIQLEFGFKAET